MKNKRRQRPEDEWNMLVLMIGLFFLALFSLFVWTSINTAKEREAFLRENECGYSHTEVTDEWRWFGKPAVKEYLHNEIYNCRLGTMTFPSWRRK